MCIVVQRHGRVAFRLRVVCTLLVGKSALLTVCVLSDPFLRVCSLFRLRVTFVSTVSCALAMLSPVQLGSWLQGLKMLLSHLDSGYISVAMWRLYNAY